MNFVRATYLKPIVLLALSIGTILLFNLYEKYAVTGAELLKSHPFIENSNEWTHSSNVTSKDASGIAMLTSDNPKETTYLSRKVKNIADHELLRLAGDIKVENVALRPVTWNTARIILVFSDGDHPPMHHLPHIMVGLSGTQDWEHYEKVFQVGVGATQATVSAQLAQTTGSMWVKNLSLRPVAISASFTKIRGAVIMLWGLALLWTALPILRSAVGNAHRITIITLAIAIMFGVLIPENMKENIGALLLPSLSPNPVSASAITPTFKFTPLISQLDIFKAGHFILFSLLAVASRVGNPFPELRVNIPACLFLFALVSEVLQLFASARNAQLGDVTIDSLGISLGLLIAADFKLRSVKQ